jgi:hypothetical protein
MLINLCHARSCLLDLRLSLWPRLGLDYSTHTAVALVLVLFLSMNAAGQSMPWLGSLAGYAWLMTYQGYHSLVDIATTALAVAIPAIGILNLLDRRVATR